MSRLLISIIVAIGLVAASAAGAVSVSLGSHLAFDVLRPEVSHGGTSTVLAWPSNTLTYSPGLRVAVADLRHAHELQFDSGLFSLDEGGSTLNSFVGTLGYQYTIASSRVTAPFVNVDIGVYREGGAVNSSSSIMFGMGAGMRHTVGGRHGDLRVELRADRLHHDDTFGRPAITAIGVRLGFDLWM